MRDVFILGAGFSKAINTAMPTMEELSSNVISKLKKSAFPPHQTLYDLGNDIELWMTYLSQEQPWLRREHHHRNLALATDIRRHIRDAIVDSTHTAVTSSPPPPWLELLIGQWHSRHAVVITLNYDTLIERAAQCITDDRRGLAGHMYPAYFTTGVSRSGAFGFAERELETFGYYSLHGSTNLYYSGRESFYGETIFRLPAPAWGTQSGERESAWHRNFRDKEALIIPPVTDKLTYFNNETIRRLWQEASELLQAAPRVFVIGYSLPVSDLGMKFFLQHSQPSEGTSLYIIDKNPEVVMHYMAALPNLNVKDKFVGESDVVSEFVAKYPDLPPT